MRRSFTFRGQNCEAFGVILQSVQMPLLPEKRKRTLVIPGRDGTVSPSAEDTYANVEMALSCAYHAPGKEAVRQRARAITEWLSKKGELEFSDEPGRYYDAEVVEAVDLENRLLVGSFTLLFTCGPYALSRPNVVEFDVTGDQQTHTLQVSGTMRTPCLLTIKNTGAAPIRGLQIGHKMEVQ